MPEVVARRNPSTVRDGTLMELRLLLPEIVAAALTCENPNGKLTKKDVEVYFHDFGRFDVTRYDLAITITANPYPERMLNLHERRKRIITQVEAVLPPGTQFYVWITPPKFGEFGEGVGRA